MKMDSNDEVYKGYLLLPAKALIKNKWQQKYCYLYKASKAGIARLEVWDSTDITKGPPFKIITLENCITVGPIDATHIRIITKTASHEFGIINDGDINVWVAALQSVAFPDDPRFLSSIEEDNDLYCSSGEGVFNVRIHSSPASDRCGLDNKVIYILVLTSTSMQLKSTDGSTLFTWPYCFIRRYGYKHGKFTFEAGRKCDSGEGDFFLEHPNQQEIFRCLSSKMKSMKTLIKNGSSPAILDCGENQLHAALNMEARSRSPLPPSPTSSTTLHDIENNSISSQSTIAESLKSVLKPAPRPVPSKPPRKNIPPSGALPYSVESSCEELFGSRAKIDAPLPLPEPGKYTAVEFRTEAWKTLGVDDVNHTENIDEDIEEDYQSWGDIKKHQKSVPSLVNKAPAIISHNAGGNNEYDQLNFFGSSSKLNLSSTYKQIAVSQAAAMPCPPSFNDYDEVQPMGVPAAGVNSFEKRLADDSHLGYAQIRKEALQMKKNSEQVSHHLHNETPYAVISKPKRV